MYTLKKTSRSERSFLAIYVIKLHALLTDVNEKTYVIGLELQRRKNSLYYVACLQIMVTTVHKSWLLTAKEHGRIHIPRT